MDGNNSGRHVESPDSELKEHFEELVEDVEVREQLFKVFRLMKQVQLARAGAMRKQLRNREYMTSEETPVSVLRHIAFTERDLLRAVHTLPAVQHIAWNIMLENVHPFLADLNQMYQYEFWGIPPPPPAPASDTKTPAEQKGGDGPNNQVGEPQLLRTESQEAAHSYDTDLQAKRLEEATKIRKGVVEKWKEKASDKDELFGEGPDRNKEEMSWASVMASVRKDFERHEDEPILFPHLTVFARVKQPANIHSKVEMTEENRQDTLALPQAVNKLITEYYREAFSSKSARSLKQRVLPTKGKPLPRGILKSPHDNYRLLGDKKEEQLDVDDLVQQATRLVPSAVSQIKLQTRKKVTLVPLKTTAQVAAELESKASGAESPEKKERSAKRSASPPQAKSEENKFLDPEPEEEDDGSVVIDGVRIKASTSRLLRSVFVRLKNRCSQRQSGVAEAEENSELADEAGRLSRVESGKKVEFRLDESQSDTDSVITSSDSEAENALDSDEAKSAARERTKPHLLSPLPGRRRRKKTPAQSADSANEKHVKFDDQVRLYQLFLHKLRRSSVMSRVHDKPPPCHLTDDLLMQCAQEQGPTGEEALIVREDGFDLKQVKELRIDYKSKFSCESAQR